MSTGNGNGRLWLKAVEPPGIKYSTPLNTQNTVFNTACYGTVLDNALKRRHHLGYIAL